MKRGRSKKTDFTHKRSKLRDLVYHYQGRIWKKNDFISMKNWDYRKEFFVSFLLEVLIIFITHFFNSHMVFHSTPIAYFYILT